MHALWRDSLGSEAFIAPPILRERRGPLTAAEDRALHEARHRRASVRVTRENRVAVLLHIMPEQIAEAARERGAVESTHLFQWSENT